MLYSGWLNWILCVHRGRYLLYLFRLHGRVCKLVCNLVSGVYLNQKALIHLRFEEQELMCFIIGDFRVAFRLCFKVDPSAKPFIWKLVLNFGSFTCE